jgi:quinol monooxygenase YgiN
MSTRSYTTLNLKYSLKPDAREAMLAELTAILDLCAQEPEFIAAFLQETPDRPNELLLFEIWQGTHDDFLRTQGPKQYRQDYIVRLQFSGTRVGYALTPELTGSR